jgi:hypothetical protein
MSPSDKASNSYYVRCVSGTPKDATLSFTDNGDGTVKDNATGLIWQKCSKGLNATDCSGTAVTATWASAISYCGTISNLPASSPKTWRLPQINELKTIVDTTKATSPAIDTTVFPATVAGFYWSSSTFASDPTMSALGVMLGVASLDGTVGMGTKTGSVYVRCVTGP